jgi:hypothetical protein
MQRTTALAVATMLTVAGACNGDETVEETTGTTTTSSSTTSTSTLPATTITVVGATTCRVSQLSAALSKLDAGAGQHYAKLVFTNNSSEECTMFGYPGMQLLEAGGGAVPTTVLRNMSAPKTLVTLPPNGGHAYTALRWGVINSVGDAQDGPCQPDPARIQLTPPNESSSLFQPWSFGPVCEQGTLGVNPMLPGTGA